MHDNQDTRGGWNHYANYSNNKIGYLGRDLDMQIGGDTQRCMDFIDKART